MKTIIRTRIYTAVSCVMSTAALCAAVSTSVKAQEVPSKVVRFSDLDITRSDGAKALYNRIRAAARDVCEQSTGTDPIMREAGKACIEKAIDKAVKDVNAPMLTYLRFGSTGVRLASK
ncbi:MAG TPA: UrcA family protein [Steroidobacteraceae bacterium]|nr:UrcA family protein [Steroidobacteraceae bacterium]